MPLVSPWQTRADAQSHRVIADFILPLRSQHLGSQNAVEHNRIAFITAYAGGDDRVFVVDYGQ